MLEKGNDTDRLETRGVKAFRFHEGVLSTGKIGDFKNNIFEEGKIYEKKGEG